MTASDAISWHGVGGRTVTTKIEYDLQVVQSIRPDIVVVKLGNNDLSSCPPLKGGSHIENFAHLLHDSNDVKCVCVCQTIRRRSATAFNKNVDILICYLRVDLEPILYAIYWGLLEGT